VDDPLAARKREHLALSRSAEVGFSGLTTGLERVRVRARALPERDLGDVDLGLGLWGRRLRAPLLISSMTGGVGEAGPVNRALATAAQEHGVALGLGSGRILLEQPQASGGFEVRDVAPDVLLLANLGAAQLERHGPDACAQLVARCGADGLIVHLNAVQEGVQRGGDTAFGGVLARLAALAGQLAVPLVVKEVGFGMAPEDVAALVDAGVAAVDVAGAGGTNWARVEGLRDERAGAIAAAFGDWGWPTAEAVRAARRVVDERGATTVVIGSGGLRHGVDALKVLCLGAHLAGVARGLLEAGARGPAAAVDAVGVLVEQLRIAAWACGAASVADLVGERLEADGG
jgi:isopentenyl-diphosphate Delta-isomerase